LTEVLIVDLQDKQVDAQFVQHVASHAARARDHGYTTVSIALVTDEHITELNKAHLGRARATDVLAYQGDADEPGYMGDVVVSTDAAARQAQEAGRPLLHEVAWLAAHGVLHLLGCDDATGPGRAEMFALQDTALADVLGQRGRESREEA
jgi:rRNA maturation RNase YbeY